MESALGWLLGLLLGMRHAFEPDHLTAVSTLVTEERRPLRGAWLGAWWGIGHTLALLLVGSMLALLHSSMPPRVSAAFELGVAAMLVGLGARSIRRGLRDEARGAVQPHAHGPLAHQHATNGKHLHVGRHAFAVRSLAVGLVHGLAGSGALVALVVATLPSTAQRIAYMALFGVGSVLGMALVSGVAGIPLARWGRRPRVRRVIAVATGALSIAVGVVWALESV